MMDARGELDSPLGTMTSMVSPILFGVNLRSTYTFRYLKLKKSDLDF